MSQTFTLKDFENLGFGKLEDKCKFCDNLVNNVTYTLCSEHVQILRKLRDEAEKLSIEATDPICPHCEGPSDKYQIWRYETCQECCEHDYDADEGFMCLNCGDDGAEEVMARAYDRAKDSKYD